MGSREQALVDPARVLTTALDVASGLQALHANGLLHGQVTLDNVLLQAKRGSRLGCVAKLAGMSRVTVVDDDLTEVRMLVTP